MSTDKDAIQTDAGTPTPQALAPVSGSAKPCAWIVTRTIKETYAGFGRTREEAIEWVNEKGPGPDTVNILTESARKVRQNDELRRRRVNNL